MTKAYFPCENLLKIMIPLVRHNFILIFLLPEAKNEHFVKNSKTPFYLSIKLAVFGLKKKIYISSCSLGLRDIRTKKRFEKSVAIPEKIQSENFKKRRRSSKTYNIPISLRVGM
jgi:hypothetical protein